MLSEFEPTWDGHLRTITTANHRIELADLNTPPVHSAPYDAGPKGRKFKKAMITEMLGDNTIKLMQT